MPYGVEKVKGGFKVIDPNSSHVFSKRALSKKQANKQRVSIALAEARKTGKPIKNFFL